jgi:hypothetical protein
MSSKKPYFGIKPFDEKRKKKYREPSIAEAFDAGQIRYYGLHAVSSLLGLLPRMKRSQLKELDKWTKVHYKLPIFKKSESLPEPEVIDETLQKKNQAATKIQSLVRMKKAKKQLQTLKDNVHKKIYNDLIKMLETYKEIRQNADYYKNNRDEFQKKVKQFSTERSTLVDNKLDDLDHEIIISILKGIDTKIFTKLNELTKLIKYVNTIYENLGTSNEVTEKNNLMKYIYPLVEDLL